MKRDGKVLMECNFADFIGEIDNMMGSKLFEFGTRAEAPGNATGGYAGIAGGLHIHTRVAHVEHVSGCDARGFKYLMHDGGVGLGRYAFTLAQHGAEGDGGEIVSNKLLGGALVLVGSHGQLQALALQLVEQLRDAIVGGAQVGIVLIVIGDKGGPHTQDVGFRLLPLREGALEEFVDTVAHHEAVGSGIMYRIAQCLEGMVGALRQVGNGVEQGTVEVENYKFLHWVNICFYPAKVLIIFFPPYMRRGKKWLARSVLRDAEPIHITPSAIVHLLGGSGTESAYLGTNPLTLTYLEGLAQRVKLLSIGAVAEAAEDKLVVTAFTLLDFLTRVGKAGL